jgi:integrase/recombinase XerD
MHRPQVRSASEKELSLLLAHVTGRADRARRTGTTRPIVDELLVLLLVDVGLRPREVCALALRDVLARCGRTGLRVRAVPGAAVRTVEVPERVDQALARFIRFYRKGAQPADPLLLSERGTPLSYMSLYSKIRRIGRDAGLAELNPGALRFAFLRRLYDSEQDLRYVQEQAGHAHLKTTARYIRALTRRPETAPPASANGHAQRKVRSGRGDTPVAPPRGLLDPGGAGPGSPAGADAFCESCGKPVSVGQGAHIDSGQLLCPDCIGDLREPRP